VVRFNTNGSVDTSFGGTGTGYATISAMHLGSPAVAVQSDDRIVIAATVAKGTSVGFGVARLNPDVTPDASFGFGGFADPTLPIVGDVARSVAIQANGRIVVFGGNNLAYVGSRMVLARYNAADGSLDTSFGNNGVAATGIGPYAVTMAIEPDGRIVEVGIGVNGSANTTVARFLATGPQIGSFTASPSPVTAGSSTLFGNSTQFFGEEAGPNQGGAIFNNGGTVTITDSTLFGNSPTAVRAVPSTTPAAGR
jgi:uncharacterized delta-60 repeat protein